MITTLTRDAKKQTKTGKKQSCIHETWMSSHQKALLVDLQAASTAGNDEIQSVFQLIPPRESHCPVTCSHAGLEAFSHAW